MKKTLLVLLTSIASTAMMASAAEADATAPAGPKNLARHHLGANLFLFSQESQAYLPTQASSSWLDDDISTGMSPMPGKQDYLLALPDSESLSDFAVSGKASTGTVTLSVSDVLAPPTAKSWSVVAKDVPFESLNEKAHGQAISKNARYVLIETNLSEPMPIYSVYLYGTKPASEYSIRNRDQAIDPRAVFGPWVNDSLTFNVASTYAQASVKNADGSVNVAAQAALDDNPNTSVALGGASGQTEIPVTLGQEQSVSRISVKTAANAKGRFDFFLANGADVAPGATPTASITLDGGESRASVDFPATQATMIKARWTPANGSDSVSLTDLNAFGHNSLATAAVASAGDQSVAVAGKPSTEGQTRRHRTSRDTDPKAIADGKDAKEDAAPIAAFNGGPYLPGALGFPPNFGIPKVNIPPLPPEPLPVSP